MEFVVAAPLEFSFDLCASFLKRSPRELLHRFENDRVRKLLHLKDRPVLIELCESKDLSPAQRGITIRALNTTINTEERAQLEKYVREWFDLDTDLKPFYEKVSADKLLGELVTKFHGYRIVGQPDLFESLVWAVLGQQINLAFAYTLKQRFVEQFGTSYEFEGQHYYAFPGPEVVAQLTDAELLPLQFSRQKSKYTVEIGKAFAEKVITQEALSSMPLEAARDTLMQIKGVGNWTANYALMKTFRYKDAFPAEDVGIHNSIRLLKKSKRKPTVEEVRKLFKKYKGWEAYATLYLWKSLP
ncbi:DNA-3-methyladenine glycosylase 2 [Chryseolinea sp. T2]|uniref:DNA-3-methyladenine glycosylase family protein n=1 Tax=Chryseolinea sp. T2 TaxID=3129255 RepID=UPI0030787F19